MMIPSQRIIFTNVTRRLFHGTSIFNSLLNGGVTLENKEPPQGSKKFVHERMLEYQNTSIKSYLNVDKIMCLKPFYERPPKDELSSYNFVIDENVAIDIVKHIVRRQEKKGIVLEGNPGIGLITNHLIMSNAFEIIIIKENSGIEDVVTTNLIALKGNVTKKLGNLLRKGDTTIAETLDMGRHIGLPVTFVAVTTGFNILKSLVFNVINYQLLKDQLNMFLVIDTFVLQGLIKRSKMFRFQLHCLFNFLFTVKVLETYPRDAFLPKSLRGYQEMHLVQVSYKPDVLSQISSDELMEYKVFLKILGKQKEEFVIPTLEKWAPGCGPYLISKGLSMTTRAGELSHEEAFLLFTFFKDFDGYSEFRDCSKHLNSQ